MRFFVALRGLLFLLRPFARRSAWFVSLLICTLCARSLKAQVVDVELGSGAFWEPSSSSQLTVLTPSIAVAARPSETIAVQASYEADIVSGASEAVKVGRLGADIASAATSFSDTRHVASGGFTITRESTSLSANYAYGTENDYRSNAITVSAATDFLQHNTELALSYGRGFDKVCTSNYRSSDEPSARTRLDSSSGCFSDDERRETRDVNLDNFQAGWTQAWTPVFSTQLVLTAALQNGFLENPYRAVTISESGDEALENHPENRARAALALRGKYYLKGLRAALGVGARFYRDTWDVFSHSYELEAERYMAPWLTLLVRGRFYSQSGALFWSDDYTGGEPETGPRGQYWTGDRELSPLKNYLIGARLLARQSGRPNARVLGMFLSVSASVSVDALKTDLEEFTWAGKTPDDTLALLGSLAFRGEF